MTFISGWAGFKELFPKISKNSNFFVPFADTDVESLKEVVSIENDLLIGWSLGAHLILKCAGFVRARKVVLLAPFLNFTDFVNPRIINKMIQVFKIDKQKVISEFYEKIGAKSTLTIDIPDSLVDGLEFLKFSKVSNYKMKDNFYCICASFDALNLANACINCCKNIYYVDSNHYFSEAIIERVIEGLY